MAKEIIWLKQSVAQLQNELTDNIKQCDDDKERSLNELKVASTMQFEEEKRNMSSLHSQEIEGLQVKIESTLKEKQEAESLKVVRDQALITNMHLQESQLKYLSQVGRLHSYMSQGKMLLSNLSQQRKFHK